ncbi:hypothetical protein KP509_34G060300 [Ceratopteris richardii]|uniref:Vacuolar protein sorting-associated protein 51 homolog n=1 Tax=Ceratopteris richardii TaxID=49495 RepID=A0A8T2QM28_CERRI|nr:hypothetical protein KP509_34G060300 [Ceratopteris richardii]
MAEGIESKTKRVRDLLSSFYGDEEEPAHSSPTLVRRDTLQAINTKAFDADRYMSSLVHRTNLEGLLQKHVEMAAEIKNLDSDMQMLVYENYNKFISATDTIRRMKDNISGMESNVERLLEKITAVRAKSDGINASLFERRERIEELNGTRGLLRKVQFVFDLPIRLRKCLKAEAYGDAVKYYKGALPVLKAYGRTSFQTCKQESDEVIAKITKSLKVRATSVTESVPNRAEAIRLLQELNNPVQEIMEKCLMQELERLSSIIKGFAHLANTALSDSKPQDDSEYRSPRSTIELLSKFLASFSQSASTFRKIFPFGEQRFREAGTELFKKYLESVQKSLDPDFGNSAAKELVAVLKILSTDVPQMDEVLPKAGLSEFALQTAEGSVRQHISKRFKGLFDKLIGVLMVANTPKAGKELEEFGEKKNMLESLLLDAEDIILQGSRDVLLDLKMLLDDRVNLMIEWRSLYVDLVQGGIQDLFVMLNNHFSVICFPTGHETSKQDKGTEDNKKFPVSSGFVLLLARFSIYVEQTAVPKITEEIAMSFTGGGTRGPEDRPIFVPTEICRLFRATGEQLLDHMPRKAGGEWEYVDKVKALPKGNWTCRCKFCGHIWDGGANRIRAHILGLKGYGVDKCAQAPQKIREACRKLLAKSSQESGSCSNANVMHSHEDIVANESANIDDHEETYVSQPCGDTSTFHASQKRRASQGPLQKAWEAQARADADKALRRFFFAEDIPFWKVRSPYFLDMVSAIGRVGSSYKPPSYHLLRTRHLCDEVRFIEGDLLKFREKWKRFGCSIVCDGWSDVRNRPIINIMVSCIYGSMFLRSVDTSGEVKTGEYIFEILKEAIKDVGPENVVQVCMDNATNCVRAGSLVEQEFPHIFYTRCTCHCIDLLFEDMMGLLG